MTVSYTRGKHDKDIKLTYACLNSQRHIMPTPSVPNAVAMLQKSLPRTAVYTKHPHHSHDSKLIASWNVNLPASGSGGHAQPPIVQSANFEDEDLSPEVLLVQRPRHMATLGALHLQSSWKLCPLPQDIPKRAHD